MSDIQLAIQNTLETKLPLDLVDLIINKYIAKGILAIQRKFRNYNSLKKLGWNCFQCEDCYHYFWVSPDAHFNYGKSVACCDALYDQFCCWKYKCPWRCIYNCDGCGKPIASNCYDKDDILECCCCGIMYHPHFVWYGLTSFERYEKYGW